MKRRSVIIAAICALGIAIGYWSAGQVADPPSSAVAPGVEGAAPAAVTQAPARRAAPPALPEPESARLERPADEWQGMTIDADDPRPPCDVSARCGLARACVNGECVACGRDSECAGGEVCVLNHCVLDDQAACRSRADCEGDELCVLTGYSADARGNREMQAICRGSTGGQPPPPRHEDLAPAPAPTISPDSLLPPREAEPPSP